MISEAIEHVQISVQRLTEDSQWQHFLELYTDMENDILQEMRSGQVKTIEQLAACNAKLEVIEQVKSIQFYKRGGK